MVDATRRTARLWAAAMAAALAAGGAQAAIYEIDVTRLFLDANAPEEEQPTFSGSGTVTIDPEVGGAGDIDALSLTIATLGTVYPDDEEPFDTVFEFVYGLEDVVTATGLDGPVPRDLAGVEIGLGSKGSEDGGAVSIGGSTVSLLLDFGAGEASGFCFGASEEILGECVRGGGSSTGITAGLSAAIIPLPATLPLMLGGLAGLGLWRLRRREG